MYRILLMILLLSFALLLIILTSCEMTSEIDADQSVAQKDDDDDDDSDDDATQYPGISPAIQVVPSAGLPPQVELMPANNNLDVAFHHGRYYLAFRTAPSHFASEKAKIYVVSSQDQENWDFEASFHLGSDLREPRLLSFSEGLFLYFAVLGTNPLDFEPVGMMVSQFIQAVQWTEPEYFYGDGFIPWRTKTIDGVAYMLTYEEGGSIYDLDGDPIKVHWLTTEDGYNWIPVISDQPIVLEGGGSETDFVFLDNGSLMAVSRNEKGDSSGFGMSICRAEAEDLGNWNCINDPRKYDSPLMFKHGQEVYLIGRRNISSDGNYDLGYDNIDPTLAFLLNELEYSIRPKRTALWRIEPDTLEVEFVMDLHGRGDTCFPGLIQENDDTFIIYNYTSPLDGPDLPWILAQLGPTQIIRFNLEF